MYEQPLLDSVRQVATALDAVRVELDVLIGLLDLRLPPLPAVNLAESGMIDRRAGVPASGPPAAGIEEAS